MNYHELLRIYKLPENTFAYTKEGVISPDQDREVRSGQQLQNSLGLNADMFNDILENDNDSFSGLEGWVEEEDQNYQDI